MRRLRLPPAGSHRFSERRWGAGPRVGWEGAGAAGDGGGGSGGDRDVLPGRRTRQDLIGSRWIRYYSGGETGGTDLWELGAWDLALARFRLLEFAFALLQIEFVQVQSSSALHLQFCMAEAVEVGRTTSCQSSVVRCRCLDPVANHHQQSAFSCPCSHSLGPVLLFFPELLPHLQTQ